MEGMTQVRLISNLAAKEIYNDVLEKLRVCRLPRSRVSSIDFIR